MIVSFELVVDIRRLEQLVTSRFLGELLSTRSLFPIR